MNRISELLTRQKLISLEKFTNIMANAAIYNAEFCRKCISENLITGSDLTKVIWLELSEKISFKEACLRLSVWNTELDVSHARHLDSVLSFIEDEISRESGINSRLISASVRGILNYNGEEKPEDLDYFREFKGETIKNLKIIKEKSLEFEKNPNSKSPLQDIFRSLRSLQAAFGILDLSQMRLKVEELQGVLLKIETSQEDLVACLHQLRQGIKEIKSMLQSERGIGLDVKDLPTMHAPIPEKNLATTSLSLVKSTIPAAAEDNEIESINSKAPTLMVIDNFTKIEAPLIADFAETFDDARRQSIESTLLKLENNVKSNLEDASLEEDLRNLYRELHTIKGTSRFISAKLTEKIIHQSEDLLGFAQTFQKKLSADDLIKTFGFLLITVDTAWEIRDSLVTSNSEEQFWVGGGRDKYLKLLGQMQNFKKSLDQRGYEIDLADVESMF